IPLLWILGNLIDDFLQIWRTSGAKNVRQAGGQSARSISRPRVFLLGFGVESVQFARPTILRLLSLTISPGTAPTLPFTSSARRRGVSCFQADSISGSTSVCNVEVRRSTTSATCSRGNWLAASTI